MGLDLGRVQGAGWFHTSAASSTSISVSSLQPQLTPFVGDAVLFPNGDVRQIIGVSGSTVTLGNVLWSNKGDPSISNATLSNVDGDSTTDGFTQAAVKGIAQAKNYYNLGAYNTYVSNGDGTGTVTRKTYYVDISRALLEKGSIRSTTPGNYEFGGDNVINLAIKDTITFVSTVLQPMSGNEVWNGQPGIAIISYRGCWICVNGLTTNEQYKAWLANNKILVQYKLAAEYQYTERVIENQPIRLANQEEEWYWHEEWRKGLNLYNRLPTVTTIRNSNLILSKLKPNTTYCIFVSSSENYEYSTSHWYIKDETLQVTILDGIQPNRKYTFTTGLNVSYINFIRWGTPPNLDAEVRIMITEGIHTYPFETYNGKILHEIDLSSVQLFPEDVNPAETIGGDWEDKGTVTTSDNTVFHAYRRLS